MLLLRFNTTRAHSPDPQARGPLSLWTEVSKMKHPGSAQRQSAQALPVNRELPAPSCVVVGVVWGGVEALNTACGKFHIR